MAWSDALQAQGRYAGPTPDPPFVGGHEFAGLVVQADPASGFDEGERVFGFLPSPGAFAEFVAADGEYLTRTPEGISDDDAASFSTSFLTADLALRTVGGLRPGASVLVHAAAGGVGRCAVQLARLHGAGTIVATAGTPERRSLAEAAGADIAVGYDEFPSVVAALTEGRGVDIAVESVGGDVFDRTLGSMAPLGRLVTLGASSEEAPRRLKLPALWQSSVSVCGMHLGRLMASCPAVVADARDELVELFRRGRLQGTVGLRLPAAHIEDGMRRLQSRSVNGRVVLDVDSLAAERRAAS